MKYEQKLGAFQKSKNIISKGALAIVIQLTADVRTKKFPLNPESFKTPKGGQVAGLSGKKLQKILQRYGIKQSLASEAGRTSRGSIQLMTDYLNFLNEYGFGELSVRRKVICQSIRYLVMQALIEVVDQKQ